MKLRYWIDGKEHTAEEVDIVDVLDYEGDSILSVTDGAEKYRTTMPPRVVLNPDRQAPWSFELPKKTGNQKVWLQGELSFLNRMLAEIPEDEPINRLSIETRKQEVEEELATMEEK